MASERLALQMGVVVVVAHGVVHHSLEYYCDGESCRAGLRLSDQWPTQPCAAMCQAKFCEGEARSFRLEKGFCGYLLV